MGYVKPDGETKAAASGRMLTEEQREEIANALYERGALQPCPRCTSQEFQVIDGYVIHPLQRQTRDGVIYFGGPSLPVAVIACKNCGYLCEHALGMLGLMKPEEGE